MFTRPKPKTESVPFERLVFVPRLQMRDGLPAEPPDDPAVKAACWRTGEDKKLVCVADPKVARDLADTLDDDESAVFDALEVVRAPGKAKKSQPVLYVFGGFTRGAAYALNGKRSSVPCNVYEGTWEDALFYALSENHKNKQSRGAVRKAIDTLLDSTLLMERVRTEARKAGGLHRAIAVACRVSPSSVTDALRARGKSVQGMKLVDRQTQQSDGGSNLCGSAQSQVEVIASEPAATAPGDSPSVPTVPPLAPPPPGPIPPPPPPPPPEQAIAPMQAWSSDAPEPEAAPAVAAVAQPDVRDDAAGLVADVKSRFARERVLADKILRALREVATDLDALLSGPCGAMVQRVSVAGSPLFVKRSVRHRSGTGTTERAEWASAAIASVAEALRRTRPRTACAACRGEGCPACKGFGFVPDDIDLIRTDDQLTFDFPNPWDLEN